MNCSADKSAIVTCAGLLALAGLFDAHSAPTAQGHELRVISSRPDTVSGGNALVEVNAPQRSDWSVYLNNQDTTQAFRPAAVSGKPTGLLTGLKLGRNVLEIRVNINKRALYRLDLLNHPLSGPIFSGPHQTPFVCQTEANGLGPPLDADCTTKTIVEYYYNSNAPSAVSVDLDTTSQPRSLPPGFKLYDAAGPHPDDMARILTGDGRNVPFIVRRERGVINRAVYEIRFLHQPGAPLPTPWMRSTGGWNGRLVYEFGGGCAAGYRQGLLYSGTATNQLLAAGYAIATSTLNVFGNTCNDRISAETLSMVKERFIEQFGPPAHTIGQGGSGGAIQQYLIAQNYPGLLDGIIPNGGWPDVLQVVQSFTDCALLDRALKSSFRRWTEAQKTAASGFATWRTCANTMLSPGIALQRLLNPANCDRAVAKDQVYDSHTKPHGVRCDLYENEIAVFGRDPRTGFAHRPLDNVGVQYGLVAFNRGQIDAEQFLELNAKVGGFDGNGELTSERNEADLQAVRLVYERGLVVTGGGALAETPIVDWHWYTDDLADHHSRYTPFVTRARLTAAQGNADNQAILVGPRLEIIPFLIGEANEYYSRLGERSLYLVQQMDRWLDGIAADDAPGDVKTKVARNRPVELTDGCWTTGGERIAEHTRYESRGRCGQLYPPYGDPRLAAGAPLADDIVKCALKPVDPKDYIHLLTAEQIERVKRMFSTGVCDYRRPGVGQRFIHTTWQRFTGQP